MTSSHKQLVIYACAAGIAGGLGGVPECISAQNSTVPTARPPNGLAAPAPVAQDAGPTTDEDLRNRVQSALHADPYFYDAHVAVSVEHGAVVLRGFVMSEWDLHNALRIAKKAAGDRKVIDNLSIKEGGRR
jgi:hypothetical protein